MSYLAPPPAPAPVVVVKDVGGYVTDYQNQTAVYRITQREVRLHECRSACTLALSLPNVCVYPDSILKFHLAYDPRNHQPNAEVSQQMFDSYPAAVRARLGTLTREYKVLRGSELIELGIRNCNAPKPGEPRIMTASAVPARQPPVLLSSQAQAPQDQGSGVRPVLAGLMNKMLSVFGAGGTAENMPARAAIAQSRLAAKPGPSQLSLTEIPLPPQRPLELAQPEIAAAAPLPVPEKTEAAIGRAAEATVEASSALVPAKSALPAVRRLARDALPELITGAQPILPPGFSAYAEIERNGREGL